jgi:hypothetical protein
MLKRTLLTTALAALIAAHAAPTLASEWAFDDPYWKANEVIRSVPTQFADRTTDVKTDAAPFAVESDRATGTQIVVGAEAQKARLDRAGFPQYSN